MKKIILPKSFFMYTVADTSPKLEDIAPMPYLNPPDEPLTLEKISLQLPNDNNEHAKSSKSRVPDRD